MTRASVLKTACPVDELSVVLDEFLVHLALETPVLTDPATASARAVPASVTETLTGVLDAVLCQPEPGVWCMHDTFVWLTHRAIGSTDRVVCGAYILSSFLRALPLATAVAATRRVVCTLIC